MTPIALPADFEACRRVTRRHAKSFYFASHVLPRERRAAAFAIYAFCRSADDAIDEAAGLDRTALEQRLRDLRTRLDHVFAGNPDDPCDHALAETVLRHRLSRDPFDQLIEGLRRDVEPLRLRTTEELLEYCHLVAGVVGHMLLPVLGAEGEEARARAADLGIAMQLTNILRDVGEDLGRGRVYLPVDELRRFGLDHADVESRRQGPEWQAFVRFWIDRARGYYARARLGIPLITTRGGRLCVRVMASVYGDILRVVEQREGDVFTARASTSTTRKLLLLAGALRDRPPAVPLLPPHELVPVTPRSPR